MSNAKKARESYNLIDKSAGTSGMLLGDGSIVANANYLISTYIPAVQGTYSYSFIVGYPNARFFTKCFYDENQNYLSGERIIISNAQIGKEVSTTFSAPAGTVYMRVCIHNHNGDGDYPMLNSGLPLSYEPYGAMFFDAPCAVKRYTAGEEKNTLTDYSVTFNGLTTIKDRQFMKLEGTSTDAIFSTDESFRSSFNFKLKAGKVYIIAVSKYFSAEDVIVYVRYRNDNSIIVSSRDNPVATIAPNIDTNIYSGFDFPARTSAPLVNPYLLVSYRYPGTWHDTPVYVRQNGVWVEQT